MKNSVRTTVVFLFFAALSPEQASAQNLLEQINEAPLLTLNEFLTQTGKNTFFEEILIDTLDLKYSEVLALPAEDVVLGVKGAYQVLFPSESDSKPSHGLDSSVSLSKLFADSGTSLSAGVSTSPSGSSGHTSQFVFEIAQPIAQNAFGKANRLTRKLTQIEDRILEMQIVEAYEDYYAVLITLYYTWHAEYAALQSSQNSYITSRSLIEEMESKYDYGIANQLDLDKSNIQLYSKLDSLIQQETDFKETMDLIKQAMMIDDAALLYRPQLEDYYSPEDLDFDRYYTDFQNDSRTYEVFSLTEERSDLNVRLRADELLPSANLYANYRLNGRGIFFAEGPEDQSLQIGVDLSYPIASSQARASYEREKIDRTRTALSNANKKIELKNDLRRLFYDLESGVERIALSDRRVEMANRIAESESRDYNLGKSDLNDLISALNQVDTVAQSRISAIVRQNQNTVELLRFTDRLVSESVLDQAELIKEKTEE